MLLCDMSCVRNNHYTMFCCKYIKSFRSPFMVNVEWSCDQKNNVNVQCKRLAVKVISDQRTCTIFSLKPVNIHHKNLVVKEMLDQHTSLSLQPHPFSAWISSWQRTIYLSLLPQFNPVCCLLCTLGNSLRSECCVMVKFPTKISNKLLKQRILMLLASRAVLDTQMLQQFT